MPSIYHDILLAVISTLLIAHFRQLVLQINCEDALNPNPNNKKISEPRTSRTFYFQIHEPESLRYTFKARSSKIGSPFTQDFKHIAMVLVEPIDACSTIINKLELRDNLALVERGGCSFLHKCIEVEKNGSIGLVVFDNDKHNDENFIEMIDDSTSRNCSIPAISLLGRDGHMIMKSLMALRLDRAVISLPIQASNNGPPWLIW